MTLMSDLQVTLGSTSSNVSPNGFSFTVIYKWNKINKTMNMQYFFYAKYNIKVNTTPPAQFIKATYLSFYKKFEYPLTGI